ncbi:MAG: MFS transporter [Saprospiraceae bacterium]|nr:MFS transporter [Saprospiraceae bacterium]
MDATISHNSKTRTATVAAGIIGNVMEWYDFAVYGFFASTLGQLFFPAEDDTSSLIASFGAFAAGFLMRPVGGAFFGYIGDRIGRKRALNLSVLMMAVPTFLIGVMPTHAEIGVTASVLLVVLRMLQGLSVGGEYTSSVVYLAESAPAGKRGLFASTSLLGATGGILLGSMLSTLLSKVLTAEELGTWGWRIPFILGVMVAGVGFLIRRHMPETLSVKKKVENPLRELLRNWRQVLQVSGLNLITAVGFYGIFVFSVTWLIKYVHEARTIALEINTTGLLVFLGGVPLFAWLSDRVGRRPVLLVAGIAIAVLAHPITWLMYHSDVQMVRLGEMGLALLLSAFAGPVPALLAEMFPGNIRVSAVSVGYNLTYAIFGGTTPMVAVWLINKEHDDLAFAWYLSAAAVISLLFVRKIHDRAKEPLPE